jgi:alpha-1,6-mannosyltransferase
MRVLDRPSAPLGHPRQRWTRVRDAAVIRTRNGLVTTIGWLDRPNPGADAVEPYIAGETHIGAELVRPAVLGFIASLAIFLGASQKDSPFTQHQPGAWILGIPTHPATLPTPPGQWLFLGVIAVYGGMLLMLRAWADLAKVTTRHPGIPVKMFVPVFLAWVAPLMVVAPLFSRDVYSYAAQGELMTHHINPYIYGPQFLIGTPFQSLTDQLWANVPSPYGPVFLALDGWIVQLTGHNALLSIELLRVLALAGTAMLAIAVPMIARSFGRDGASAFVLAVLNPLVLLHLVGGIHNDSLMLGLLVVGYAAARRGHPIVGIVLCSLASMVKITALLGVLYIGWEWLGENRSTRERLRPVASAIVISSVVMVAVTYLAHIGWGWVKGLSNPDTVRSWIDPATGLALFAGRLFSAIGLGDHTHLLISAARGGGLLLAAALTVWLLIHSDRIGPLRALGFSLVALVVLSPVIQPWYLCWGFVFLAPVAERAVRRVLIGASAFGCFLGLPGGRVLIHEISIANPWHVAAFAAVLVAIAASLVLPRIRKRGSASPTTLELDSDLELELDLKSV